MEIFETKAAMRSQVRAWRMHGLKVGFVPTMGFLHEGHLALVRMAASRSDRVIVSIFVNPIQFGANEDFDAYPRDTARDLALLRPLGVASVFMPMPDEMYDGGKGTIVDVPELSGILQGAIRPGHFQGVATVVTKLLHICEPDCVLFGEKDYQQLLLIRRMVRDLDMAVDVVGHPTVREPDGLAMSSRNVRLSEAARQAATVLSKALDDAEASDVGALKARITSILQSEPMAKVESVDIRDAITLAPVDQTTGDIVVLLAVRFDDVLLIDQRVIQRPD